MDRSGSVEGASAAAARALARVPIIEANRFTGSPARAGSAAQQVTVRNDGGGNLGVTASIPGGDFALACITA